MPRPQKPDNVIRILKEHDERFVILSSRGKGSHRMIEHPSIDGRRASFPIPYHKGQDLRQGLLSALIRRFKLPKDIFG